MGTRWNHRAAVEQCVFCGRVLEPYESCDCMYPLPKDGLRAICPEFKARSSYKGRHYISCKGKYRFDNAKERDEYYAEYCCENYRGCLMLGWEKT